MAYNKPAVQVYQELANAGGAQVLTPQLPACVIGPLRNVVQIDLTDAGSSAGSLSGTLNTWPADGSEAVIPVNATTAYVGQTIVGGSTAVTLVNPLVQTFVAGADVNFASGVGTLLDDNANGTSGTNEAGAPLPFDALVNHVNVGDPIVVGATTTFVTSITGLDITVAAAIADGAHAVSVYHKYAQHIPGEIDFSGDTLSIGGTANTRPATGYSYAVDAEINSPTGDPMNIHIGYVADRADVSGEIQVINDVTQAQATLGIPGNVDSATGDVQNPLAFGVNVALANSGGNVVYAIALNPGIAGELAQYTAATELAEGMTLYNMVPLTTDPAIASVVKAHVDSMSLPTSGKWRIAMLNTVLPERFNVVGSELATDQFPIAVVSGTVSILDPAYTVDESMIGHTVNASDNTTATIESIVNQYSFVVTDTSWAPAADATAYISKAASKQDQAQAAADQSAAWNDKRVMHFPGNVTADVNGVDAELPGYYLMCGLAGQSSGFAPQQGFTNISVAGISGLMHSNFYFNQAQLDLMAEFGTVLYVQDSPGTTPYCRHALTTDVSVLEYREILKVKNWDYLSYTYKGVLEPFIGTWNITPETLQSIRSAIISTSENQMARKLPKVGAPLLSYEIARLEQNANQADAIDVELNIAIVSPNNYTNVYLVI